MARRTDNLTASIHDLKAKICTLQTENAHWSESTDEQVQLLTQAVDHAADSFLLIDETGRFIDVNQQACCSLGYSKNEILQMGVLDIDVSMSKKGFRKIYRTIKKHGAISIEGIHRRKDGSQFPVEQNISLSNLAGHDRIIALARDISERKQFEQSLKNSEMRHRNLIDSVHDAIIGADSSWNIIIWNRQAEQMFGYSEAEAMGQPVNMIVPERFALFHERVSASFANDTKALQPNRRLNGLHKDGHEIPIEVNLSMFRDASGQMIFTTLIRDMTTHDLLEQEMQQAQKMDSIGTLVGGIAHDFNNMLAGITANLYLINRDRSLSDASQEKIKRVNDLCDRAATMIGQLLTFARKGIVQMESIAFVSFLEEALKLTRLSIPENINVEYEIECDSAVAVFADPTQLQQLLLNLLVNARDAIEHVSEPYIHIGLRRIEQYAKLNEIHQGLGEGPWLKLSVADNGCGIPEGIHKKLFEPFFTTKKVGKGSGLGLAMVYGVIQSHHGAIEVASEEGKGTTFHIYLPIARGGPASSLMNSDAINIQSGKGETILLVDDEEIVRTSAAALLSDMGYKVVTASNGKEALQLEGLDSVDLALLDVVMPEMGGVETAEQLRRMRSNIPIIFATAYDCNQVLDDDIFNNSQILSKPFRLNYMSRTIRKMLDS